MPPAIKVNDHVTIDERSRDPICGHVVSLYFYSEEHVDMYARINWCRLRNTTVSPYNVLKLVKGKKCLHKTQS